MLRSMFLYLKHKQASHQTRKHNMYKEKREKEEKA